MYHKALALASVGDYEGAEAIFASNQAGSAGQTRRGVIARAEILGQLGRNEQALALLTDSFGASSDPELDGLVAALQVLGLVVAEDRAVSEVCRRFEAVPQLLKNVQYSRISTLD